MSGKMTGRNARKKFTLYHGQGAILYYSTRGVRDVELPGGFEVENSPSTRFYFVSEEGNMKRKYEVDTSQGVTAMGNQRYRVVLINGQTLFEGELEILSKESKEVEI